MTCTIRQITSDEARRFWQEQADARIFLHPDVLEPMCERVDWWLAEWDGIAVCLWPVCLISDGGYRPPELSSYVGPLWHDSLPMQKANRWWAITSSVQEAMIACLASRYDDFMFELPPRTSDIRVFQWFQSEHASSYEVSISPRHTTFLRRPQTVDTGSIAALFGRDRRRNIRDIRRSAYRECDSPSLDALCRIYSDLLNRKSLGETARIRQPIVRTLIELASRGFGQVIAYGLPDGMPLSFIVMMGTGRTPQSIIVASTEDARRDGLQAWVRLQAMLRGFQSGAAEIELVGGNSRIGSAEKHRYGAWPEIYFRIAISRRNRWVNYE